jgi:hypothetical protein
MYCTVPIWQEGESKLSLHIWIDCMNGKRVIDELTKKELVVVFFGLFDGRNDDDDDD